MKQDSTNLSKNEAIQALDKGHKLTHTYFDDGEWIAAHKVGTQTCVTEEGYTVSREQFWNDRQGEQWETGWSILNEGNSTKTPLWSELNERRTKGEWYIENGWDENGNGKYFPSIMMGSGSGQPFTYKKPRMICNESHNQEIESIMANAQYTALAVNNFARIAEALTRIREASLQGLEMAANGEKFSFETLAGFVAEISGEALTAIS